MKKNVKLILCGLAAVMLIAGCSKKEKPEETATVAAEETAEITKLGTYKGVEVTKPSVEVTDEELDQRIQSILDANPEYVEITDRPAQNGDVLNIDFVGMKDGVAFDGGTAEGYQLELGSGQFIEGFEEGLVGANVGDELSLNLNFPDPYPNNPDLAGAPVVFDVTVNGIEEVHDAVLDDNFVQRMSDFTTVDEFRADTLADMEEEKETQAQQQLENDAFQMVLDTSEFNISDGALEAEYQSQLSYCTSMVESYGMTLESYTQMFGMTLDQFQDELRTIAGDIIRQRLVLDAIAEAEKLEVTDEDLEALAEQNGMEASAMKESYGEDSMKEEILRTKALTFIVDNAAVK